MTTNIGLSKIGQIMIVANDLREMTAFYRDKLGMKLLFEVPNMTFFDCDGIRLMLTLPSDNLDKAASVIYFDVPDINEAYDILSTRGVSFERKPEVEARLEKSDLWLAFFRDPEGNFMALMSEVARPFAD